MIENKENKELERRIDLYIRGKLNAEQADDLWAELIQDEYYLDYMKSVANVKAIVDRKNAQKEGKSGVTFQKMVRYASAAAVILVVIFAGIFTINNTQELSVSPVSQIGLEVIRDASGVSENVENDVIRKAIRLATDGNVEEAVSLLETELDKTTEPQLKAELALSLGSIQYNNGNYSSSIESFNTVISLENVDVLTVEKGYWFLGNTYFQLDRLEEAEAAFKKAYELNGAYSRVAKTYVDALGNVSD